MRIHHLAWVGFLTLAACEAGSPLLSITDGALDAVQSGLDLGSVAITATKQKQVALRNISDSALTLRTMTISGDASFALVDGTCHTGLVLAPHAGCTVNVRFTPSATGASRARLELVTVRGEDERSSTVNVVGVGVLDCNVADDLKASFQKGASDADAENRKQAEKGTADGRALRYDDGYNSAYPDGRKSGYDSGYHDSTHGYDAGYRSGYVTGNDAGLSDASACTRGDSDGAADGTNDGYAGGQSDGQAAGYPLGYSDGVATASGDCALGLVRPSPKQKAPQKITMPSPATMLSACYDQGRTTSARADAYSTALEQAKLANTEYQRGLQSGDTAGYANGFDDGERQGYADGTVAGNSAGYTDGSNARYSDCYQSGYAQTYDSAYRGGYADGHADGYDQGYGAGYDDVCVG